jgi:hypothetical protein
MPGFGFQHQLDTKIVFPPTCFQFFASYSDFPLVGASGVDQISAYMCKLLSFHVEPPKAHFTLCNTKEV